MRFKCPECEAEMALTEEQHVCPNEECGKSLSIDEATELFEDGKIVALVEEAEAEKLKAGAEKEVVVAGIDEDIAALTEGEDLSEAFVEKAKTIFEAAVTSRVAAETKRLTEEKEADVETAVTEAKEELVEKINGYLDHVIAEWIEENRVAIEEGVKIEMNEAFVEGLSVLFKEHFIQVPGERWDIVEGLAGKVEELEGKLDASIDESIESKKTLLESEKKLALITLSEGLADTQKEKLAELVSEVTAETLEDYTSKVSTIKESYFTEKPGSSVNEEQLGEEGSENKPEAIDPMAQAIAMLNRKA